MNDKESRTFIEIVQQYENQILELKQELQAKQSEIDWLMLAYCPDEMSEDQVANWKQHQKAVHTLY